MIALASPIPFADMAKKKDVSADPTEQINFRLKVRTIERMDRYKAAHELRPTMTQLAETAINFWLDIKEGELPKPRK